VAAPSIRPANEDEAPALRALVEAAYAHYVPRIGGRPDPMDWDYAALVRDGEVLVAEVDGALAGVLVLGDDDEHGFHIANVAVAPAAQGSGIGRALLELAEARGRQSGAASVLLWTHELMTENRALYKRIGYVEERPPSGAEGPLVYLRKPLG
jgi:ribosomal protein S18 acetylase RimI-like enzyme